MNATRTLTHLTMIVATAAAAFVAQASDAMASPNQPVVQLERVVITGKRLPAATTLAVVELPRVVIVGKRLAAEPTTVVQLPRVVITGKRLADQRDTVVAQKNARGAKEAG